jgi:hypothetical protein
MLHFTSQKTERIYNLYKGKNLGASLLGNVFTLIGVHGESTNLVGKIIDTNINDPELSKQAKIRLTVNEIKILNELDLLEGYVREDGIYTIVMKEAKGLQSHFFNGNSIKWEMYRAIKNLYLKNNLRFIIHPNHSNIDPRYNRFKVSLIDFGPEDEGKFCNITIDHLCFLGRNFYSSPKLLTVVNFYVLEMIKFAMEGKYETCNQLLLIAALTLSGLYNM